MLHTGTTIFKHPRKSKKQAGGGRKRGFSMKQQYGVSKGIANSEAGKQVKNVRLEPVEMTIKQANCV